MVSLPTQIIDRVSIKYKEIEWGFNQDAFSYYIYLDKIKIGYIHIDNYEGMIFVEPYSSNKDGKAKMKSFKNFLTEQNFVQFVVDDYNSVKISNKRKWKVTDFNFEKQVAFLCMRLEFLEMVERKQENAILFGNPRNNHYKQVSFMLNIETLKKHNLDTLKKRILEIKSVLNKDECIFNINLQELLNTNSNI